MRRWKLGRLHRCDALGDIGGKSLGDYRRSADHALVEFIERDLMHCFGRLERQ